MGHEIVMLLLSFCVCSRDTAGNILCNDLSGVDNDDFVATLVKMVTCLLKCYHERLDVCDKPLLNVWTLLENGVLPCKHAYFKLRDDSGKNILPKS